MATIFKACLVTGYGDKASAGWTMAFEDMDSGVKVIRPPVSAQTDYYMRLSEDDGKQMTVQVYLNMTDINTGDLKLQCATPFKYGTGKSTGKWILIASPHSFWFFLEAKNSNNIPTEKSGSYLFCGNTAKNTNGVMGIYLKHTGGTWGISDDDRYDIFRNDTSGATVGKLFNPIENRVVEINPSAFFHGEKNRTNTTVAFPLLVEVSDELWALPAVVPSRNDKNNYDEIKDGARTFINHAHAQKNATTNLFIPIDYWEY